MKIRVNELIKDNNISIIELSKILKIDITYFYAWIKGRCYPNFDNLIKLADYFNCSIDYLICRTEDNSQTKFKKCPPFAGQLKKIMKEKSIRQIDLINKKIANPSHFYKWFNQKSTPKVETLIKLADYFNVSIDYLIGREI